MKKVLVLAVIAVFVMMPLASFAKTAISDSEMGAVTAQEGVSIEFSSLSVSNVAQTANTWGDADGFTGATGVGYYGQVGMKMEGNVVTLSGGMNIDVGSNAGVAKIKIGLPTIQIGTINQIATVALGTEQTLNSGAPASNATLGHTYTAGVQATITGGLVIYAH